MPWACPRESPPFAKSAKDGPPATIPKPSDSSSRHPEGRAFGGPKDLSTCGQSRRFYDFNPWSERKRIEKLRYTHRNPVKRGLVLDPSNGNGAAIQLRISGRRTGEDQSAARGGDEGSGCSIATMSGIDSRHPQTVGHPPFKFMQSSERAAAERKQTAI